MVKKKGKKPQKQVEWNSPILSPKSALEELPSPILEAIPLSPATDTIQREPAQSDTLLADPKPEGLPLVAPQPETFTGVSAHAPSSPFADRPSNATLSGMEKSESKPTSPALDPLTEPVDVESSEAQSSGDVVLIGTIADTAVQTPLLKSSIEESADRETYEPAQSKHLADSTVSEPELVPSALTIAPLDEDLRMAETAPNTTSTEPELTTNSVQWSDKLSPKEGAELPQSDSVQRLSFRENGSQLGLQAGEANSKLEPEVEVKVNPRPATNLFPGSEEVESPVVQVTGQATSQSSAAAFEGILEDSAVPNTSKSSEVAVTESPQPQQEFVKTPASPRQFPQSEAVKQILEDSRPAAPTPPVTKARLRHPSAFDDDTDDDPEDSALIHPRRRGDNFARDPSRGLTYPPQPSHSRSVFASRVPVEHYTNPPPPPPPPGYHPRYYPPTAPPYYHSHTSSMNQSGVYSSHGPYGPPSHSSSPYQESWSQLPPSYPPYSSPPTQRHDSVDSRDYPMNNPAIENGTAIEDDSEDVFTRISQALPDLHYLLAKYKETHGQLGVREELLRRAGVEQTERLKNKDDEINHLKDKLNSLESKRSSEVSRLRFEIGNMEEQMKELREQIADIDKFKREAEETRLALEAARATWEAKYKELESATAESESQAYEEKERVQKDFEEWKSSTTTKHDAEKIALAIQFDKKLNDADVFAENQRQEAAAAFVKEKEELRTEHQRQQRERDASSERVRKELETKLSTAQKDREEALRHKRESREVWEVERETLVKSYQEDRDSQARSFEEQRDLIEAQYKKNKEESDKAWIELHTEANRKTDEEKAKVEALTKEKDELQRKYGGLKAEHEKEQEVIKSIAGNLETERARLEKLMECYGDIAEIKSKGDTYYLVSFSQLQKQIMDLAVTHFKHLPVTPPPDVLEHIPPEMPSFLGNTDASRQIRAAYIVHTVSAMVTFRVFGPFLFSLGRRYDKADSLFLSMSNHIRDKSTRKEAIWRQQTLLAAFTSSGAKQRINTAAGTVVDEIVTAIKHFADPKEEEAIKIAVRRVVKLAAETWRFARLEREMIVASMPAAHDQQHELAGGDYWKPYKPDDTPIASLVGTSALLEEPPRLLLRLFPVIRREPKHENFRSSENEKPDEGCVYHHGLALYDDARPVETRKEEIRQAGLPGLPPSTHASPTAADFPPPLIPPPRKPPPLTPEIDEDQTKPLSSRGSSPAPVAPPESPTCPPVGSSEAPKAPYVRPIPGGPIHFTQLIDGPHLSATAESTITIPSAAPNAEDESTLPGPTESAIIPSSLPPLQLTVPPLPEPAENINSPQQSSKDTEGHRSERGLPTPPGSPSERPPSPLFPAEDEIEALRPHRSRNPSAATSRRSTPSKSSNEELRQNKAQPTRRTSGYNISNGNSIKSFDERSQKTDKTERSSSSRYTCESRSAAIKALYPNSPLAGTPSLLKRTNSLRRQDRTTLSGGTWDTESLQDSSDVNPEPLPKR